MHFIPFLIYKVHFYVINFNFQIRLQLQFPIPTSNFPNSNSIIHFLHIMPRWNTLMHSVNHQRRIQIPSSHSYIHSSCIISAILISFISIIGVPFTMLLFTLSDQPNFCSSVMSIYTLYALDFHLPYT